MIDPHRIPTYTGKRIDPFDMSCADICIEDIAHHLSLANRYVGATEYPYSVGQHSLLVMDILFLHGAPPLVELAGGLHDASETWLGDVVTPIKVNPMSDAYRAVESRVQRLVEAVFWLPYGATEADIVKWADNEALQREWYSLIEPNGHPTPPGCREMAPKQVEERFLERIASLDAQMRRKTHDLVG